MKKAISFLLITLFIASCNQQTLNQVAKTANKILTEGAKPTEQETVGGLKEALTVGAKNSVGIVSKTDGFLKDEAIKILLPKQGQDVINKLQSSKAGQKVYDVALKPIVNDLVTSLNRSAEDAAQQATPIFVNAITSMSIQDAFNILMGSDSSATQYLRQKTFEQLVGTFAPQINTSLDKKLVGNESSNSLWNKFTKNYNDAAKSPVNLVLGLKPIEDTNLSNYVTRRALEGLFVKVALEEKKIRENPMARVSELLKKVFGYAAQNKK
jgi:hypothetical protein